MVSPMPSWRRMASARGAGHDALHAQAGLGEPEVQRIVGARGQPPVHVHEILHARDLRGEDDAVVAQATLLGQLRRANGALHHGVEHDVAGLARSGLARVGVHHLGEEQLVEAPPVDADAHGLAVLQRHLDDGPEVLVVVLAADVARVDAQLGQGPGARRILLEEHVAVVVEVADDGDVDGGDDVRNGAGRRLVVDRHAHQLAARRVQGAHLGDRAGDVGGVGVGHRLDHDGAVAADLHSADVHQHGLPAHGADHGVTF